MTPPPLIRRTGLAIVISSALLVGHGLAGDNPKPTRAAQPEKLTVMQRKLAHAKTLLEGLATEDFHKIRMSAAGLQDCVKDETWRINDTEKYLMLSDDFLRHTTALQDAAKKKNIDAAALAYVGMTLNCVKCHEHIRDQRGRGRTRD